MLVLTRKSEEQIIILCEGKEIVISVLQIAGGKVSLGFEAESDVSICRKEVFEKPKKVLCTH